MILISILYFATLLKVGHILFFILTEISEYYINRIIYSGLNIFNAQKICNRKIKIHYTSNKGPNNFQTTEFPVFSHIGTSHICLSAPHVAMQSSQNVIVFIATKKMRPLAINTGVCMCSYGIK